MIFFLQITRGIFFALRWLRGLIRSTARGNARWMNRVELKIHLNPKNKGLVLSPNHRLPLKESFDHLGLIGTTGSGKTSRFIIPNILNCQGSIVVTDLKGKIFEKTSGHMKDRGYKIQVLAPSDPQNSFRFNPLKRFTTQQELKQIATTLGMNNAGKDPFWTTTAINIIYICLCALAKVPDKNFVHLGNIRWLLNNFGANGEGIKAFMNQYLDKTTFSEYKAFIAQDSKIIASILSSARAALDLWSDPEVVRISSSDNMSIESLRKEKTIIYMIVPSNKIKYFSIILNLFYSACFEHCIKNTEGLPVFFFLDEFGNLDKIDNFESIATTLREYKCSINMILQSLSQLESVYGRNEAKTIFSGGVNHRLFFSGMDLETCEYLEKVLGTVTKYDTPRGGVRDKAQTVASPLLSSDKIRMLEKSKGVLISGGKLPIIMKMPFYFRYRAWQKLTEKKSVKISFDYSEEMVKYLDLRESENGKS